MGAIEYRGVPSITIHERINRGMSPYDVRDWKEETGDFDLPVVKGIVRSIENKTIRIETIECIVSELDKKEKWRQDNAMFSVMLALKTLRREAMEELKQAPEASTEAQDEARTLPKELANDEAKALLEKAKAAGFLDEAYKWKSTQQLAAYFAYRASQSLNLSSKQDSQGNITTCWKPFETLFGYETGKRVLSTAKANWMRVYTRFEPTGYEQIDALFTT